MDQLPDRPKVSVVIPALNAAEVVIGAIESALAQPEVDEVIVAAGDDETLSAAESFGDSRVSTVDNSRGTTPAGLNLAWRRSSGDVIVRCDAHARLPSGYVGRALETMRRTKAANVGGMQIPIGSTPWERAVAAAMSSPLGAGDARYRRGGGEGPVETVYLGVFERAALEELGGFDETFVRNQDYELNHRLMERGHLVWFDPQLKVAYRPRSSLGALARQYFRYGQAKRHFARRHPGNLRWRQLAAPGIVLGMVASAGLAAAGTSVAGLAPVGYLIATVGDGLRQATSVGWRGAILVAPILWTMHFSWGCGFLIGEPNDKPPGRHLDSS